MKSVPPPSPDFVYVARPITSTTVLEVAGARIATASESFRRQVERLERGRVEGWRKVERESRKS